MTKAYHKAYHRKWYLKNRKNKLRKNTEWNRKHPARRKFLGQRSYRRNREKINKNCIRNAKRRAKQSVEFRILRALRTRVYSALKGIYASKRTLILIGCSVLFLKTYLQRKFKPGMTWANWGSVWHIDHIKPCAAFDLKKSSQRRECFHYTNLQPLTVAENKSKSSKWKK